MYSQAEEDAILAKLLWLHGVDTGTFVEIGVGSGYENNTRALAERGWRGLWIGDEPIRVKPPTVDAVEITITPDNVLDELTRIRPPVDVFSLDIDGNDYWIAQRAIPFLDPRIVIVEYNRTWAGADAIMPYTPGYRWSGGLPFGASLDAWRALLEPMGYQLVYTTVQQVNAFFVRSSHQKEEPVHDALAEALRVIDDLRERVDSNEHRPSAVQISRELTHVMGLIVEHQRQQQIDGAAKVPIAPAVTTDAPFQLGQPIIATHPRMAMSPPPTPTQVDVAAAATTPDPVVPAEPAVLPSAGVLRSDDRGPADVPTIEEGTAAGSGDASGGRPPDADPSR